MKKLMSLFLLSCVLLSFESPVYAKGSEDYAKEQDNIKSIIIDQKGNKVVEYEEIEFIPDSYVIESSSPSIEIGAKGMLAAPSYSSKLGAYNDNSYARAQSDSTVGIDYMFVSCSAYYPSGSFIGSDNNSNPSGTKVLALSATVEAPDLFEFQVGSADSQHVYRTAGYNEVRHFLIWPE